MHFSRVFTCLPLISGILFLSGCITTEHYEYADDHELNEIYLDVEVTDEIPLSYVRANQFPEEKVNELGKGMVQARIVLSLMDGNQKVPLWTSPDNLRLRYGGKEGDVFEHYHHSYTEQRFMGDYYCYIHHNEIAAGDVIEVSYHRPDGTVATASVRWPGLISDHHVQDLAAEKVLEAEEAGGPETLMWYFMLTRDMNVSWTLPEDSLPDAVRVIYSGIDGNRYYTADIPYDFNFEETLSGTAEGITISRNTFEKYISERAPSNATTTLQVLSIANGTVSPLLAGGSAVSERRTYQDIVGLPCDADKLHTEWMMCNVSVVNGE